MHRWMQQQPHLHATLKRDEGAVTSLKTLPELARAPHLFCFDVDKYMWHSVAPQWLHTAGSSCKCHTQYPSC